MTKLNIRQKNLIIGTLLGDGNLQTETNGRTWRYRAIDGVENEEYLKHKYNILKNICKSPPSYGEVFDYKIDKVYRRLYFNSQIDNCFRFYANLFYENINGRFIKVIPKKIEKWLNSEVIAYLYMDDGSLKWLGKSNAMRICTEKFSLRCVKRLQKAINNKFKINLTLIKVKKNNIVVGYRLYINEKNSRVFRELIEPYLIESMKYKVSNGLKNHL